MAIQDKKFIELEESSGNVFKDLGFPNAEDHLAKAELAYLINSLIKKQKLTQTAAAKLLGVDQPKISALSRGRVSGFSIDRLFRFILILNQDIEIRIKQHSSANASHAQRITVLRKASAG